MDHPAAGEVYVLGHPNKYDGKNIPIRLLPPNLGEHSMELLLECGYSEEQIREMVRQGKTVLGE